MYVPRFTPYLKGMIVAADGTVWLERSEVTSDGLEWCILDTVGRPMAHAVIPPRLRVMLIQSDNIWGVETDDMGVDYIVRYHLDRMLPGRAHSGGRVVRDASSAVDSSRHFGTQRGQHGREDPLLRSTCSVSETVNSNTSGLSS
jgi:hypothetical protein